MDPIENKNIEASDEAGVTAVHLVSLTSTPAPPVVIDPSQESIPTAVAAISSSNPGIPTAPPSPTQSVVGNSGEVEGTGAGMSNDSTSAEDVLQAAKARLAALEEENRELDRLEKEKEAQLKEKRDKELAAAALEAQKVLDSVAAMERTTVARKAVSLSRSL